MPSMPAIWICPRRRLVWRRGPRPRIVQPLVWLLSIEDQLQVLDWVHQQQAASTASTHPVLHRIDPTRCFAVAGHSMGGRSSLESAAVVVAHRIGAAIGIHPDPEISAANRVGAPFLLLTGTADHVEPTGSARADFDALTALPASQRAFASFVN